jgi:hypothetical protein
MPYLPPAHHETSKRDSPNETKIKEKQNETIPNLNSNLTTSMTHHNQTKELTTWFLTKFKYEFEPKRKGKGFLFNPRANGPKPHDSTASIVRGSLPSLHQ